MACLVCIMLFVSICIMYIHVLFSIFRADQFRLGNQLVCSSSGQTIAPTLTIPQLPGVLCVVLRPHNFPLSILAGLLVLSYFSSCVGDVEKTCLKLLTFLGDKNQSPSKLPVPPSLTTFSAAFLP